MRGATNVTLQTHQILHLPRKMTIQHLAEIGGKQLKRHFQCAADPRPFRTWSENDPRMIQDRSRQSATRHATEVTFRAPDEHFVLKNTTFRALAIFPNFTKYCACHEKWHLTFTKYCACHAKLDPRHIWNIIYNARSNKCHPPNSPNIPPATQNDHPTSRRNLRKTAETSFPMRGRSETVPSMIREWSENDPRPFPSVRNPPRNRGYDEHFVLKNTTFCAPAIFPNFTEYCTCHEKWHLTFTKYCACHEKCHLTLLDSTITQRFYYLTLLLLSDLTLLLLSDSITWLYYYSAILLLDSTITQRFYFSAILLLDSTITQRFYCLTILLLSDSITWLYYYSAILLLLLDSTITQRFYYLTLLLLIDSITWLYYY